MRDKKSSKLPLALPLLFAIAGFALAFSPPPVFAAGCGVTITTSTTLKASLGPCPNDGLIIGANGITLNCAGYTISGESNSSENIAGIDLAGVTGVTVENCNVTGFEYGFYLLGSSGNTLTGNTANSNLLDGFYLGGSSGNTLTENTANDNIGHGYYDLTTGTGTAGTANTYSLDVCIGNDAGRSSPVGICAPVFAEPITPSSPSVDVGQSVTLTVNPYGGVTPFSYQWYTGAGCTAAIAGATAATYTASPTTTSTYYYMVTDSETTPATACSSGDTVTVHPDPTVAVSPVGPLSYDVGQTPSPLTATVTYTGPNIASVEWYSSATSSCSSASTDTRVSGLSYTPSTSTAGTTYYCAVVSDSGVPGYSYASNAVEVTVQLVRTTTSTSTTTRPPPPPTTTTSHTTMSSTTTTTSSSTTTTVLPTTTYTTTLTRPATITRTQTKTSSATFTTVTTAPTTATTTTTATATTPGTTTETLTKTTAKTTTVINFWILLIPLLILLLLVILLLAIRARQRNEKNSIDAGTRAKASIL